MPNIFKSLPLFSFEGIEFPWDSYDIQGGIRDHIHEYPHVPGGNPEKLGRKLYEIKVVPVFDSSLLPPSYADLFPVRLKMLRDMFEEQLTGSLAIPHIGTIKAYARLWSERVVATNVSGLDGAEFTFIEDESGLFGEAFLLLRNSLRTKHEEWTIEASRLPEVPSIFDKINDVALQVLSVKDQIELFDALVAAKVEGLVSLIQEAHSSVTELNDPDNWSVLSALNDMMAATVDLAKDIAQKGEELRIYTVQTTMTVTQVSIAIFGDASHAVEIMQLNAFDDPLAIPRGTRVVYYG